MSHITSLIKVTKPYDKFKVDRNAIEQNKKRASKTYDDKTYDMHKNVTKKNLLLNKILNRTKSVLKNKSDFSDYMKKYNSMVTKSTFKNPNIDSYPILRKNRADMISIKNQSRLVNKIVKNRISSGNNIFQSKIMNSSLKDLFKMNLSMSMNSKTYKNKKLIEWMKKKKEMNKLFLFEDFFYKWNKKEENKENKKYSELCYDEKKIFYSDYTELIKEKINFCQNNKLENLQKKLKIDFEDKNKKKIRLELISMKLIFEPIKEERFKINKSKSNTNNLLYLNDDYNFEDYDEINYTNNTNTNNSRDEYYNSYYNKEEKQKKKNIITFPLSYVFLFYINGLEYFKNILIGSIKFSNDFKSVYFEENEIYSIIRNKNKLKKNNKPKENKTQRHKNSFKTHASKKSGTFRAPPNKQFFSLKNLNNFNAKNIKEKTTEDKMTFEESEQNNDEPEEILYATNKIIEKMHSNQDLRNRLTKKKEIKYSEYCFKWETPNKSYKVRIIMPVIIFWSEHINKNIMTYCDKELFLYLLQNNFVNWDYYILNYLFSLKIFRLIILKGISLYIKLNLKKSEENKSLIDANNISTLYLKKPLDYINDKTLLINLNKKIYNQYNSNNETYKFFYTDNFSINSIIDLNSFHIFIENEKVNKNICYEFCLNFKQMCYLINISRYEDLENFLAKIIQLNLEEGKINLDFSVLEYYNNNLLGQIYTNDTKYLKPKYNKKDSMTSMKTVRAKSSYKRVESDINIILPFIIVEQYVKSDILNNNIKKIDLNMNFLNLIKNIEINLWSKKILQLLDIKNNNFSNLNSNLDLVKVKSKDFKYYENDKHFEELTKKYNKVKRHAKSLHFKLRKVDI